MDKENYNKRLWQEMKIIGDKYEQLATEHLLNCFNKFKIKFIMYHMKHLKKLSSAATIFK